MKGSELQRVAEQNGWVLVRFGKKHTEFRKRDRRVYFERHCSKEIRTGLYHTLLKQLELK